MYSEDPDEMPPVYIMQHFISVEVKKIFMPKNYNILKIIT